MKLLTNIIYLDNSTTIAIDQEKQNIKNQLIAKLQGYDQQLATGIQGIAPKEYIGNIAEQFFFNCFKEPKTKTITEDLGKYKYTIHLELHKEDEK